MPVSSPFEELTMPKYEECALDTQYDREQSKYIREEKENAEKERLRVLKEKQELQKQRKEEELKRAQKELEIFKEMGQRHEQNLQLIRESEEIISRLDHGFQWFVHNMEKMEGVLLP